MSNNSLACRAKVFASELTDKELFTSKQFLKTCTDYVEGCKIGKINLNIDYNLNSNEVGYTIEKSIYINAASSLCRFYSLQERRVLTVFGVLFHEIAHQRYLDFKGSSKRFYALENGNLPDFSPKSDDAQTAVDEIADVANANSNFFSLMTGVLHNLYNCIEDQNNETLMKAEFGGLVKDAINTSTIALRDSMETIENVEGKSDNLLSPLFMAILAYARFREVPLANPDDMWSTKTMQALKPMIPHIEQAVNTCDTAEKFEHMHDIFLLLWPYIKDQIKKEEKNESQNRQNQQGKESQQSQQKQEGQSGQQKALQNILQQLTTVAEQVGANQAPQQTSNGPGQNSNVASASQKASQNANNCQGLQKSDPNAGKGIRDAIAGKIGQEKAEKEADKEIASGTLAIIQAVDQSSSHKNVPIVTHRVLDVSDSEIELYDKKMSTLRPYAKMLAKKMQAELKDMRMGGVQHFREVGERLEANNAYRKDMRMFCNTKRPEDIPHMAISILVDLSGSMGGARLDGAMDAALMLYEFAQELNVPVMVAGHNTSGNMVNYTVFSDFECATKLDKYRLTKMRANGCNRDGAAIEVSANLLARRPEDTKLLFIISDGQPNHDGYSGNAAAEDIRSICTRYKRKGMQIYAAAIADDKDRLQQIYQEGFLDISDLSALPTLLCKMVKKKILF